MQLAYAKASPCIALETSSRVAGVIAVPVFISTRLLWSCAPSCQAPGGSASAPDAAPGTAFPTPVSVVSTGPLRARDVRPRASPDARDRVRPDHEGMSGSQASYLIATTMILGLATSAS